MSILFQRKLIATLFVLNIVLIPALFMAASLVPGLHEVLTIEDDRFVWAYFAISLGFFVLLSALAFRVSDLAKTAVSWQQSDEREQSVYLTVLKKSFFFGVQLVIFWAVYGVVCLMVQYGVYGGTALSGSGKNSDQMSDWAFILLVFSARYVVALRMDTDAEVSRADVVTARRLWLRIAIAVIILFGVLGYGVVMLSKTREILRQHILGSSTSGVSMLGNVRAAIKVIPAAPLTLTVTGAQKLAEGMIVSPANV